MFIKKNKTTAIKANPVPALPYSYWALVLLRFILACVPQNGYIHPDEFFQSMEPITGDVLDIDVRHCWEFNVSFPLRNIALSRTLIGLPLKIWLTISHIAYDLFSVNLIIPYFILVVPRIIYFAISLINDYCLYKVCKSYGQNYKNRLLTLASSYIMLVYSTHTFSNTLEMVLVSMLIWSVADSMLMSDCIIYHNEYLSDQYEKSKTTVEKVNIYKIKKSLPAHSLSRCLQIASVTAVGIFNRPTFVGFAFPAIFFWLVRGLGTKYIGFKDFHVRIVIFVASMMPAIFVMVLYDSFYYGYLTVGEIYAFKISMNNFVVTPLNFLKYNVLSDNLASHGLHPRWLHIVVNIPILFNVLGLASVVFIMRILYRLAKGSYNSMPKVKSITGLMIFSYITPVVVLSLFPHQEPRFLISVILPVVFLFTHILQQTESDSKFMKKVKNYAFVTWCVCNIFLTMFFAFVHQGGVYFVAKHFHSELKAKPRATVVHLVTSHMYDIPQSLFLNPSTSRVRINHATGQKYHLSKHLFLYELGSKSLDNVLSQIKAIWKVNEMKQNRNFRLYLVLPSSLKSELGNAWFKTNATNLALKEENKFYPHLSVEAFPYLPKSNDQACYYEGHYVSDVSWKLNLTFLERFMCFLRQFSLVLYRVDYSSYLTIDNINSEKNI